MITVCDKCGGLKAGGNESFAGKPCSCAACVHKPLHRKSNRSDQVTACVRCKLILLADGNGHWREPTPEELAVMCKDDVLVSAVGQMLAMWGGE